MKKTGIVITACLIALVTVLTGCISMPEPEEAPRTNEINKVTFCDPDVSVEGSKSFTLKLDEVDADGKVVTSNVIFPTMVTFSSSYHQRVFNVKDKMLPGKLYKVIITATTNAVPIEIEGAETYVFEAKGGYDYSIEFNGKVTDAAGKAVYAFQVKKVMN